MLGTKLAPWLLLAVALGCAAGGDGPASSSAFDPVGSGNDTSTATTAATTEATTMPVTGDATGNPPGGSCCEAAATAGCADAKIETCVCTIEPACCQSAWSSECVDLAVTPCGAATCVPPPGTTGEPGDSSSSDGAPTLSCDQLAAQEGWMYHRCQSNGDSQCNGAGTPTTDCDYCCEYCGAPGAVSCGDLATMNGWGPANCEWNGNGACGGVGTPTCDCNFCCEVN